MDRSTIAIVLLALGAVCIALVLGGNIYEQIVCVPQWRSPRGLEYWRSIGERHPGYFFLTFAPASLVCLAAGTAVGWRSSPMRNPYALYATLAVLAALIFTRVFFLPRNRLLFFPATATPDMALAGVLLEQWIVGNYVRVAVTLSGLASALVALRR